MVKEVHYPGWTVERSQSQKHETQRQAIVITNSNRRFARSAEPVDKG